MKKTLGIAPSESERKCSKCKTVKSLSEFYRVKPNCKRQKTHCKKCIIETTINYQKKYPKKRRIIQARFNKKHPEKLKKYSKKYWGKHPEKYKQKYERANKKMKDNIPKRLFTSAKRRAKLEGIIFKIQISDLQIPNKCPALGIPIFVGNGKAIPNSPSLDRIIPSLGYVPENIIIISHMANTMKSNATLRQMKNLVDFYEKILIERNLYEADIGH